MQPTRGSPAAGKAGRAAARERARQRVAACHTSDDLNRLLLAVCRGLLDGSLSTAEASAITAEASKAIRPAAPRPRTVAPAPESAPGPPQKGARPMSARPSPDPEPLAYYRKAIDAGKSAGQAEEQTFQALLGDGWAEDAATGAAHATREYEEQARRTLKFPNPR